MSHSFTRPISSDELAHQLGLDHRGRAVEITRLGALSALSEGTLGFSVQPLESSAPGSVVIAPAVRDHGVAWVPSETPRLDFIRAVRWLLGDGRLVQARRGEVHPSAEVHPTAVVEVGAQVGPGCWIGPHVHVHSHTCLGQNVRVGSGTVVGHEGFGFERDADGRPHRFPHLGLVTIDDEVEIGSLCTIARGTLDNTVVESHVKLDDLAYVAHNVHIGANTLVMSGVRMNGGVQTAPSCWIGTGALIREGRRIGEGALVGMGSVVIRDVDAHTTVVGNPARPLG